MNKTFIKATADYCDFYKHLPAPYLRKTFDVNFIPQKAELSVCGLGFYVLYVNGTDITKGMFAPYISSPDKIMYYDTYDIKPYLKEGTNVIGIILGNGFMNPFGGAIWDFDKAAWRGTPRVALECNITDGDNRIKFEADTSFKVHESPIRFDEYRLGEYYDANYEIPNWNLPDFDDSDWHNAMTAESPRGEFRECKADPIKIIKEIQPVSITKQDDGYLYDFGINTAGSCRLNINAKAGQTVEISHCEYLTDGKFDVKNIIFERDTAKFYKTYAYWNKYTASHDGNVTWFPKFVYHGFRYAFVKGITEEQATKDLLTYCVMSSDFETIGGFDCSSDTVNTLFEMAKNSVRSNFYYFPTDCPHREKNGWTGDASMSADYMALIYDLDASWSEWLNNIRKHQNDAGALPGIVPTDTWGFEWGNGPTWDSVLFNLTYQLYKTRGNLQVVKDNAHAMLRYLEYALTRRKADGTIAIGLGDWAPVGKGHSQYDIPLALTDTLMVMDCAGKTGEMLEAVGMLHQADFAYGIYDDLRDTIRRTFIDFNDYTVTGKSQSSQSICVYYNIFDEDEKPLAVEKLVEYIHAKNDRFDSGFIGMHCIFHVLSEYGYAELAYKMITQKGYPSYAHLIDIGETSMVEQFVPDGKSCGSHNHHFFGDIARWFIASLAGLNVTDSKTALIKPHFIKSIDHAQAYYIFKKGRVATKWERTADGITVTIDKCDGIDCEVSIEKCGVPVTVKYGKVNGI